MIKATDAACVLTIDACVSDCHGQLAATIQISTNHLQIAGSGILLTRETLGIPVVGIGSPFTMQIEVGGAKEYITREGISTDLHIAERIVSYAIAHTVYPKMSRHSLWAVLERI